MQPKEILASARSGFFDSFQNAVQFIVPSAIEALFVKASTCNSPLEKAAIFRARVLLQENRDELVRQMNLNMDQLLSRSIATTYDAFRPTLSALSLSLDKVGLLDSSTFENSLRFNNIMQLFRDAAEQELVDLNLRLAVLFGQDDIRERENPFRPYLLARCISLAVDSLKFSPELTAILITQIGESITFNVKEMYQVANAAFAKHGISSQLTLKINKAPKIQAPRPALSALFEDVQSRHLGVKRNDTRSPSAPKPAYNVPPADFPQLMTKPAINIEQLLMAVRGRAGFSIAPADQIILGNREPGPLNWLEGGGALGDSLRIAFGAEDDLSWETKSRVRPPPQPSDSTISVDKQNLAAIRDLVQQLQKAHQQEVSAGNIPASAAKFSFAGLDCNDVIGQMHKLLTPAAKDMINERGEIRNLIHEQRDVLMQLVRTRQAQMRIDIVALIFESMLFDSLLPIDLRIQIGRVQFLYLQLALIDQHFLISSQHPARLLLNRIASVTIAVQHIDSQKLQFATEVERIFKTLVQHDCSIPGLFQRIINRFDIFVLRELRIQNKVIRRTVKSIEEAQIRFSQFEQTSNTMKAALSSLVLPTPFLTFLENEWVRAINIADRQNPELAGDFRKFVPDVIWSIRPKVTQEERLLFAELVPPMMDCLKRGMEISELSQFKQNALTNWLADAHSRALKPTPGTNSDLSLEEVRTLFGEFSKQPALIISDIATGDKSQEMRKYLIDILSELGLTIMMLTEEEFNSRGTQEDSIRLTQPLKATDANEMKARLVAGTAIEMSLDGSFWRGCVHWSSPGTNSLVLSFKSHAAPGFITIDDFCHHLNHGTARLLENASLFDRSILSVLKSADALDR